MGEMADLAIEQGMDAEFDELYGEYGDDDHIYDDYDRHFTSRTAKPTGPGPCPDCGASTALRDGRNGKFYGCTKFPACKGSRNYVQGNEQAEQHEQASISHWKIGDGMKCDREFIIGDIQYHRLSETEYEVRFYDTNRKYRGSVGPLVLK